MGRFGLGVIISILEMRIYCVASANTNLQITSELIARRNQFAQLVAMIKHLTIHG